MTNFTGSNDKSTKNASGDYPSIRIFENSILEWCTHVHPVVPALLWGPVALYWFYSGAILGEMGTLSIFTWMVVGLVAWTLTEYLLHRFVFHYPAKSRWGQYFVYLFHGLHHNDPNDPTRLVFPPVPAIAIVIGIYYFYALFVPAYALHVFMSAFIVGYLCYDYIHYATHHFKMTSRLGRVLKKNHLQHHNLHEPVKFGVSSPLWDHLLGTFQSSREKQRESHSGK